MALTNEQVLADAEKLVTDAVTGLSAVGLAPNKSVEVLEDLSRIFKASVEIIDTMLADKVQPTVQ